MAGFHIDRISEDIKREIVSIMRELKDPRISDMLTVVKVDVSGDLSPWWFPHGGCRGFNHLEGKITKDLRCLGDDYIPICPLIKLDLINNDIAPCTDDLV